MLLRSLTVGALIFTCAFAQADNRTTLENKIPGSTVAISRYMEKHTLRTVLMTKNTGEFALVFDDGAQVFFGKPGQLKSVNVLRVEVGEGFAAGRLLIILESNGQIAIPPSY